MKKIACLTLALLCTAALGACADPDVPSQTAPSRVDDPPFLSSLTRSENGTSSSPSETQDESRDTSSAPSATSDPTPTWSGGGGPIELPEDVIG